MVAAAAVLVSTGGKRGEGRLLVGAGLVADLVISGARAGAGGAASRAVAERVCRVVGAGTGFGRVVATVVVAPVVSVRGVVRAGRVEVGLAFGCAAAVTATVLVSVEAGAEASDCCRGGAGT